ncbi:periplasmic chaperone for outer membrane proteins Skp [Candidatus Electrothrix marina]|uniref:Periplasmic chaperone for outer membrane proteins Skp n=1 Tax=Candidatus Electrothrix marina TaxID=1859130 RepID=A0A3S3QIZ2_9BACT|nr:periplasmic chaperone for outer membrane proteins Skp [Candidatus Electrothrix marina]RWX50830.1 periplasmic chaperone for outer membrane proteins Skp [Candidatus Electrothrix marina]RWX50882.1 periplasmic chaperone for outer membrane proteins Skp [Candidatus Electrothrix marina]
MKRTSVLVLSSVFFFLTVFTVVSASATPSVGVVNLQQVLDKSSVGVAAKKKMEAKMKEFKSSLDKEKEAVLALQKEMQKKADAWNEETKKEKALELQRKKRDFRVKQDDANMEMRNLQEKHLAPIMKKLEVLVKEVAKEKGVSVIMPNTAVLYFDKSVDMTDAITAALNKKMK